MNLHNNMLCCSFSEGFLFYFVVVDTTDHIGPIQNIVLASGDDSDNKSTGGNYWKTIMCDFAGFASKNHYHNCMMWPAVNQHIYDLL